MTTISVVIPTYNRAQTLQRALVSAYGQTRPADEVIVVDDGSSDNTAEVVARFPNAQLVKMPSNQGAAAARNRGIEEANSEFIAFLDSDDIWLAHKLETQLEHMQANPDLGLLCCGITVTERDGAVHYHGFPYLSPPEGWTFETLQRYPFSTPTWFARRDVLRAANGFDKDLTNSEDLDFLARLQAQTQIEVLPDPLVVKYNLSDSIDADVGRLEKSYQVLFSRHAALWKKTPKAAVRGCLRLANKQLLNGDTPAAHQTYRLATRHDGYSIKAWLLWALTLGKGRLLKRLKRT